MESVETNPTTAPSGGSGGGQRRRRSDAQRNVVALLDAAKSVFARTGVDAPAKEITDLAGVGVGTLYRHFPRRSDLILAVMQHEIDACAGAAATLSSEHDPWDALTLWIGRLTALVGTKQGLASALHSGDPAFDDLPRSIMEQLEPALGALLDAARADGSVKAEIAPAEVVLTVALLCQPVRGETPTFTERMIRIFVEGLRSR
ncbi:TetR/AcrR family transcriptional regulator [Leifsonia poae]|uniref:TetR/AcrR family transcriptional regulator n=1 Tax=Leifsonia poae TaxID=110933 RepID=UPI001CBFE8E4|nr:TetR/AcrR family transcriptional regulator [Leifsonia poae]